MNKHNDNMWKVYTHTAPNGDVYVGVTSMDIKERWKKSHYKSTALQQYIEQFGWDAINHQVIYTCEDRNEAYQVEEEMRQYYTEKGCCINKRRSGLVKAKDENEYKRQYYKDNPEYREKHKELCSQWGKDHREERSAYRRKYYKDNPDAREKNKELCRKWREANPDYQRQWRAKKKAEKLLQSGQIEIPIAV